MAKKNINVFEISEKKSGLAEIEATKSVAEAAEKWIEIKKEIKEKEGELALYSEVIVPFCLSTFAKRHKDHMPGNFKVEGITFIIQNRSSSFSPADFASFEKKWGKKVTKDLLEIDYSSFRLNPALMADENKRKKIEKALSTLAEELGESPLLPGHYTASTDAISKATEATKDAAELQELLQDLKLTKSLKA